MEKLHIDEPINNDLRKAAGWIKFLSILNYIGMGLIILFSLIGVIMSIVALTQPYNAGAGAGMLIVSILYGVIGSLLTYFPASYGMGFSNKINEALIHDNQQSMQQAFRSLGSWFKFYGIFMIVYIVLIIIYFILMIAWFGTASSEFYY